jgi:5'(3')-deoxyribonucleotidase
MDGVISDFNKGFIELHGAVDPYKDPANWGKYSVSGLICGEDYDTAYRDLEYDFWLNLPLTDIAHELVELLSSRFGRDNICILTKPTKNLGCQKGKVDWLRKHFPDFIEDNRHLVGPGKRFCANPHSLMIDDAEYNVDQFVLPPRHGKAVLVPAVWNRLYWVKDKMQYIKDKLNELD